MENIEMEKANLKVSIIIPTYNEEAHIEECINSITNQTYQHIEEILVIDGMSKDATRKKIARFEKEHPIIKLLDNEQTLQTYALNKGIKIAKGDIIIRLDAHATYDENYVKFCVKYLAESEKENVVVVGGPTYHLRPGHYIKNCIVFLHESKFGIGVAKFRQKDYSGFVDTIWNGAFRKWIFDEIGYYNEHLQRSEDNDLSARILEKGYKIYQNNKIVAYYRPRATIKKLLLQNYKNGLEIGKSAFCNRKIIKTRHLMPSFLMLGLIIFTTLAPFSYLAKITLLTILSSYMIIDLLASLKVGKSEGFKYVPAMFVLFFILHMSYGFGTIKGFFNGFSGNHLLAKVRLK
jgi:succinoglycan biosynthesis protein ExoA